VISGDGDWIAGVSGDLVALSVCACASATVTTLGEIKPVDIDGSLGRIGFSFLILNQFLQVLQTVGRLCSSDVPGLGM
jgi:hypothetical protein